tara:strand:+ start:399 stop:902 length:504 start_codon:yes stop_codon:yes gene_type:complete
MSLNKKLDEMVNEHVVSFTKEEMATLHNDGKLVKKDDEGKDHTYLYNEMDEMNVTGGGESYDTPKAFKKKKKKETYESTFMKLAKELNEISYKNYKTDETLSSKQKVNKSIKEVAAQLFKIERTVNQNIKLKTEDGVSSMSYWKSTRGNLRKISERMMRISERLRRF